MLFHYILLYSIIAGSCSSAITQELYPLLIHAIEDLHFKEMKPCDIISIDQDLSSLNQESVSMNLGKFRKH